MSKRREIVFLLILVCIALIIRLIISSHVLISRDSLLYLELAEKIGQGQLSLNRPLSLQNLIQPGYSITIFIFNLLVRNWELAGLLVSLMSGLFSVVLVYYLSKELFNYRLGILASLIVTIYPCFINYSTIILTESLFALFFLGIVYYFWIITKRNKPYYHYILLGLIIGFSYLIRVTGLFALAAIIVWILVNWLIRKKINYKQVVTSIILVIIGASLFVTPYLAFLYQKKHNFLIAGAQDYVVFAKNNLEDGAFSRLEKNRIYKSLNDDKNDYKINNLNTNELKTQLSIGSLITTYIKNFFRNISYNARYFLFAFLVIIPFIAYGLIRSIKHKERFAGYCYIISWVIFIMLIYYTGRPLIRYYYPAIPLLLILAADGITGLTTKLRLKPIRLYVMTTIIIITVMYNFLSNALPGYFDYRLKFFNLFRTDSNKYREIGQWINKNSSENPKILSTSPKVSYYAKAVHYPIPFADCESILDFVRYQKINFILLLDNDIDNLCDASRFAKIPYEKIKQYNIEIIYKGSDFSLFEAVYNYSS